MDSCEENFWAHYIYNDLSNDMASAAAAVFDASQRGQEYAERERA